MALRLAQSDTGLAGEALRAFIGGEKHEGEPTTDAVVGGLLLAEGLEIMRAFRRAFLK